MFLPAISDTPVRIKTLLALGLSLVVYLSWKTNIQCPSNYVSLAINIIQEITIGVMIGTMFKTLLAALHTFGVTVATQAGITASTLFDPTTASQGSTIGNFTTMCVVVLIISMNLHLKIIAGLAASYDVIPINDQMHNLEGLLDLIIKNISTSYIIGVKLAFPFVIATTILFVGSGILAKLLPQLQIFFLMLPLQVLIAFVILSITFSSLVLWFIQEYEAAVDNLFIW